MEEKRTCDLSGEEAIKNCSIKILILNELFSKINWQCVNSAFEFSICKSMSLAIPSNYLVRLSKQKRKL